MRKQLTLATIAAITSLGTLAQSNKKGTFHLCAGASLGVHATHYEQDYSFLGIPVHYENDDGAATTTYPLEFHYGFVDLFSLGLYVEPGSYIDSADTSPNKIITFGLSPRFYIVNKDRFNWTGILDLGTSGLQISNADETITDYFAGGHFRLGTGVTFYFGNHFGVQLFGKYAAYNFKWRDREPDTQPSDFEARLTTSGFHFGAGLTVKLGQ